MRSGRPVLYAKQDSHVEVSGWTACSVPGSNVTHVVIRIDGVQRAEARDFFSRPDVAAAYGRPEFEMTGWRVGVPLTGLKPGEHELVAEGVGSRGEKGLLPAFRLNIFE
jgi:hypothetical protein